ncbi:hypothetical protein CDAR_423211 [Caerostris darwini]|uniref:Uncharacterized protein n=1 Tax=Caerostris darwini TaxID=1538125 RepID=A0AAV4UQR8_9ARAC|nr:hypothetical protein CDAR_423211 [Caerostris darwini]
MNVITLTRCFSRGLTSRSSSNRDDLIQPTNSLFGRAVTGPKPLPADVWITEHWATTLPGNGSTFSSGRNYGRLGFAKHAKNRLGWKGGRFGGKRSPHSFMGCGLLEIKNCLTQVKPLRAQTQ